MYRAKRNMMLRGHGALGSIFRSVIKPLGLNILKPLGKTFGKNLLKTTTKKIVPMAMTHSRALLSGKKGAKGALKQILKETGKEVLKTTRKSLEEELDRHSGQRGKGLLIRNNKKIRKR